ncbi:MAG: preprotein translocase subunit YajC [Bacteroidales bacterium]|nr:preprotein translocase subunit YajC [Bacteroidales bacterium]
MTLLSFLLEAQAGNGAAIMQFLPFILIIAVFYFFMIRPQTKRQKEIAKSREAMKVGDKVVTSGGIHGKIKEVSDSTFMIEVAPAVQMKVDKAAVFASSADTQTK